MLRCLDGMHTDTLFQICYVASANGESQMKKLACSLSCLLFTTVGALSAQNKAQPSEPIAWGALSNNASCVIFAEGHKTSGRFYGVAVTTKTVGKLTLVETQNYTFDQKEVLETQENMDNLMLMAQKGPRQVRQDSGEVFA